MREGWHTSCGSSMLRQGQEDFHPASPAAVVHSQAAKPYHAGMWREKGTAWLDLTDESLLLGSLPSCRCWECIDRKSGTCVTCIVEVSTNYVKLPGFSVQFSHEVIMNQFPCRQPQHVTRGDRLSTGRPKAPTSKAVHKHLINKTHVCVCLCVYISTHKYRYTEISARLEMESRTDFPRFQQLRGWSCLPWILPCTPSPKSSALHLTILKPST